MGGNRQTEKSYICVWVLVRVCSVSVCIYETQRKRACSRLWKETVCACGERDRWGGGGGDGAGGGGEERECVSSMQQGHLRSTPDIILWPVNFTLPAQ